MFSRMIHDIKPYWLYFWRIWFDMETVRCVPQKVYVCSQDVKQHHYSCPLIYSAILETVVLNWFPGVLEESSIVYELQSFAPCGFSPLNSIKCNWITMGASTVSIAGSQVKEASFLRHPRLPVFRAHIFHVFREKRCTNKHLCALIVK